MSSDKLLAGVTVDQFQADGTNKIVTKIIPPLSLATKAIGV